MRKRERGREKERERERESEKNRDTNRVKSKDHRELPSKKVAFSAVYCIIVRRKKIVTMIRLIEGKNPGRLPNVRFSHETYHLNWTL